MQLLDASIGGSSDENEITRCIHVGLLCVQQHPDDRPTMSTVVLMLSSESHARPQPQEPGFFTERYPTKADSWDVSSKHESSTINDITDTLIDGR